MNVKPTRYRFELAYDGTTFSGFQEQPGRMTVQTVVEHAIKTVTSESIRVIPSGRTDAGVHALKQICHLTLTTGKAIQRTERSDFLLKMNGVLPDGIALLSCKKTSPRFHARNSARKKTYEYVILISRFKNPFLEAKVWRVNLPLDSLAMQKAAKHLVGRHDFASFCAADSTSVDKTREIFDIRFSSASPAPFFTQRGEKFLRISFTGSGFLKQMIRNIIGTLVNVGLGKTTPEQVLVILKNKDRRKAGSSAPAQGLYLKSVGYGVGPRLALSTTNET